MTGNDRKKTEKSKYFFFLLFSGGYLCFDANCALSGQRWFAVVLTAVSKKSLLHFSSESKIILLCN